MVSKISVIMLTKNASKYLEECLEALVLFPEIIIIDNGSSDDTITIAKTFENVTLYTSEFIGFGPLKNMAISKTTHEWVLSVDSDEILTTDLVNEILQLDLNPEQVYAILRKNYYRHTLIECCGWEKDYVNRLFYKDKVQFNHKQVHESLLLPEGTQIHYLQNSFMHYSFDNASQLLQKMNHYSTLYAKEHCGKKKSSLARAISNSIFSFIKNYFFQKGFLYGYEGFLISISNANGVFYKYIKLMEENRK